MRKQPDAVSEQVGSDAYESVPSLPMNGSQGVSSVSVAEGLISNRPTASIRRFARCVCVLEIRPKMVSDVVQGTPAKEPLLEEWLTWAELMRDQCGTSAKEIGLDVVMMDVSCKPELVQM